MEDKYYRLVPRSGKTYGDFINNMEIGGINTAPDWDPDPKINCGNGIHIVKGHPFEAIPYIFSFSKIDNYVIFEVEPIPNPPVKTNNGMKYRCQSVKNIRILGNDSPEFDSGELIRLTIMHKSPNVRMIAASKLNPELNPEKYIRIIFEIARTHKDFTIREIIVNKLDSEKHIEMLSEIARTHKDFAIRRIAKLKLKIT